MFTFGSLSAVAVLAIACVARPTSNVVVEKLESAPSGWIKDDLAKVDKDATSITLKIHLVNKDMEKFQELAMNVSDHSIHALWTIELIVRVRLQLPVTQSTATTSTTKLFYPWWHQSRNRWIWSRIG
jgi:hypothetical protein